ncbi:MAG: sensor domain-containing diguanylate cyclase [Deltaproteobacteria bacterium]|nr:sensor domain-containing diguanylate cyclase [Deltaproteobacteria bacterium]
MNSQNPSEKNNSYETDKLLTCLEVGKLLTSTLNLRGILELIMSKVSQLVDAENWSLLLKDQETGELSFEIAVGIDNNTIKGIRLAPGEGIAGQVAETGEPVYQPNVKDDPRFNESIDERTGFTTSSIVCIPLTIHRKILGVIEIINVMDMELFKAKDLPILMILADYAAIAIENSQYFARIQRMSVTDEYTGFYNVRYLHHILDELIMKADKSDTKIAVVFGDIDNFKDVVDEYGHLLGSQVLKEIAVTISRCLTEKDILVKYGGDEYVIILPDRNKEEALDLAETILQSLRESTYLKSRPEPVKITASFGIAVYPDDAHTKKDLLLLADNSMYKVKRGRKDGIGTT